METSQFMSSKAYLQIDEFVWGLWKVQHLLVKTKAICCMCVLLKCTKIVCCDL